jgi:hypothetical protein
LNRDHLVDQASRDALLRASEVYEAEGFERLSVLIRHVREVYRYVPPESVSVGVTVIRSSIEGADPGSYGQLSPGAVEIANLADLGDEYRDGATVLERANGRFVIDTNGLVPVNCAEDDLIYHFHPDGGEAFYIAGERISAKTSEYFLTAYAVPTFFDLEEALDTYTKEIARYGQRHGLRDLWRDESRLMFLPAPEERMRRSLEDFLDATLRLTSRVELRPEQNVDETKPADIKVTFSYAARLAYIEIKWMGDSAPKPLEGKSANKPRGKDVQDGAKQLANYLDLDRVRSNGKVVTGYLVVFDARRRGIKPDTAQIDSAKGMYYENREVAIAPDILARPDFASPRRMFMEPVCNG